MRRGFIVFVVALSMVILLSLRTPQAASSTASTSIAAHGIYKVIIHSRSNVFGYSHQIAGSARDFSPPFLIVYLA
jgi:hypothetical protein